MGKKLIPYITIPSKFKFMLMYAIEWFRNETTHLT